MLWMETHDRQPLTAKQVFGLASWFVCEPRFWQTSPSIWHYTDSHQSETRQSRATWSCWHVEASAVLSALLKTIVGKKVSGTRSVKHDQGDCLCTIILPTSTTPTLWGGGGKKCQQYLRPRCDGQQWRLPEIPADEADIEGWLGARAICQPPDQFTLTGTERKLTQPCHLPYLSLERALCSTILISVIPQNDLVLETPSARQILSAFYRYC